MNLPWSKSGGRAGLKAGGDRRAIGGGSMADRDARMRHNAHPMKRRLSRRPERPRRQASNPQPRLPAGPVARTGIATVAMTAKGSGKESGKASATAATAAIVPTGRRETANVRSSGPHGSSGASARRRRTRIRRSPNSLA